MELNDLDVKKPVPSLLLTTLTVLLLSGLWGMLRLFVYDDSVFPLTFVLPLLVCVWTRRRWQLWTMAVIYAGMTVAKIFVVMPEHAASDWVQWSTLGATLFNIIVGAAIVEAVMSLRTGLEEQHEKVSAQNVELEAQAEEMAQQNEEIKAQAEELAQQNEEIESQTEELERQNEELQETNTRLGSREGMLQAILQSARAASAGREALEEVCRRALEIVGFPAEAVAVLELEGEGLRLRAHARLETQPPLREIWPLDNSLARVVLEEERTAYVDDLFERTDLAAPFAVDGPVRSLLVTPLRVAGSQAGVLAICGRGASHWTRDQFRLAEWIAGQCGLIVEGLRWQHELKERAVEVEAANRAKDQFLAMLSHELRTPLTPVLVAAGALEGDPRLPEDARKDAALIRRNATVQSRLIDDLLDLTRVERGKIELHRQVLRLREIICDAATIVEADLDARDQTLSMDLDMPEDASVDGDGARLQQVFWNLLKNAIKFSPQQGRISLSARVLDSSGGQAAIIEVADNGVGIEESDLARIFLPFEQAIDSHRGNGHGLGLGLAIAKAVVELHGGAIRAQSSGAGQGSTFTVELPLVAAPLPSAGDPCASLASPAAQDGPPMRVLLVEDHEDTGRLIARLLRGYGFNVEHAQDVAGAVELFRQNPFDLVVSDLGLPDGSGLDVMRELQTLRPGLAGICMSGYGMDDDVQAAKAAGFHEHLTKPVDVRQLQDAIGRVTAIGRNPPSFI
jgi:signal transduction histidine kinase/response regulator RpfG family c-di-GMP phosphodiesterase